MPEIVVYSAGSRPADQKQALCKDITDAVVKNYKVPADAVVITLVVLLGIGGQKRHLGVEVARLRGKVRRRILDQRLQPRAFLPKFFQPLLDRRAIEASE